MTRLKKIDTLGNLPDVTLPGYRPADHGNGILHIGIGAFHRAHQAVYTDDILARSGGNWRILGVSLRRRDVADQLNPQNGLYTLITRHPEGAALRVIGSVAGVIYAPHEPTRLLANLCNGDIRIVSLTITEKGYGLDPQTGGLDTAHPAIAHDLQNAGNSGLDRPLSAIGLIVAGLAQRRAAGIAPYSVMSCDNLAHNGRVTKRLTYEMARHIDPELADWIAGNVAFPSTMVDRITPAATEQTFATAKAALGVDDMAAIETEPFTQWVIEDDFVNGRPDWDQAGAIIVADVAPFEKMKLRMLNGAHTLLACLGCLKGHRYVRDVMNDADMVAQIRAHMQAAAQTLPPVPGIDLGAYRDQLLERFANPAIAHATAQIAMDGSQKMPPRIFDPALDAQAKGQDIDCFAYASAVWMVYVCKTLQTAGQKGLNDPRADEIATAIRHAQQTPQDIADALCALSGFMPEALRDNPVWQEALVRDLTDLFAAYL